MQDRPALAWTRAFVRGLHCPLRLDVINKQASRRTGTGVRPARKRCRRVASHVPRHALGNERTAGILRIRPSGVTGTFPGSMGSLGAKSPPPPSRVGQPTLHHHRNGHVMMRASRRGRRCRDGGMRRRRTPPPPPRRRTSRSPPRPRSRSGRRRSRGGRARPCG